MSKKLLLINTGGTFSSVPSEKGLAPGIDLEEIMRTIGPIGEGHTFELKDYASLDSANITPEDWVAVANLVAAAREDCDGVVIIHARRACPIPPRCFPSCSRTLRSRSF